MFAAERNVDIFSIVNALNTRENEARTDPRYKELNPAGGVPFLCQKVTQQEHSAAFSLLRAEKRILSRIRWRLIG